MFDTKEIIITRNDVFMEQKTTVRNVASWFHCFPFYGESQTRYRIDETSNVFLCHVLEGKSTRAPLQFSCHILPYRFNRSATEQNR